MKGSKFSPVDGRKIRNTVIIDGDCEYRLNYTVCTDTVEIVCKSPNSKTNRKQLEYFASIDVTDCKTADQVLDEVRKIIKSNRKTVA